MVQRSDGPMVQRGWRQTQDGFKSICNQFDDNEDFLSSYMWRRSFNHIFNIPVAASLKIKIKYFKTIFNPYILNFILTMANSSDEDYVKNKDYHTCEEGESSFVKIQPKREIC